jgi:hypothetical protein
MPNMTFDISLLFFSLFIVEQIIMVKFGSYPYTKGFVFAKRTFPTNINTNDVGGLIGRLAIKEDYLGNIYIRYKNFPLTWGPYVFVGEVTKEKPNELTNKVRS